MTRSAMTIDTTLEADQPGGRADEPGAPDAVARRWTVPPDVVAVLVVRDGESFLPRTLAAIAAQTRPPDRLVTEPGPRVPDALDAALAGPVDCRPEDCGPEGSGPRWLWVLHDDSAPAPDALERLLAAVETAPSVAVAGCKQVSWDDGQRLLEVGSTTSRLGARITGMDRGEVDQGQHDRRSDMLAVGTAGMLIRRDVWEQVRGRRGLTGARDDLDLCRRVHLAGHRVVVVPGAVVAHAAASATGRRPGVSWYRDDRRDALFLRLATVSRPLLIPAVLWSLLAGVFRAVFRLAVKQPGPALDELLAMSAVAVRPDRWLAARRADRVARRVPVRSLRPLRATARQLLRQRRDEVAAWIVPAHRRRRRADAVVGAHAALPEADPVRPVRSVLAAAPVLVLAAAAGVAQGWPVLAGQGAVTGPYLLPAPADPGSLWSAATSSWRAIGLGAPGLGDPFGALLAALSIPFGGDPGRLVAVLLVGGPLLAAIGAWYAAGQLLSSPSLSSGPARVTPGRRWLLRSWAALTWAAGPPLLAATGSGRPAAVLAHVILPLVAVALCRASGEGSVAAAAGAGLLLTGLLAAAPSLAVPAAVAVVVAGGFALRQAAGSGSGRLGRLLPLGFTAAVPGILLLPWWTTVLQRPLLLLADPAIGWTGSGWSGSLLPIPPISPVAVAVAGPAVLLALAGPLRRGVAGRVAVAGWLVGLAGIGVALVGERVTLGASRSWPGPGQSVALLGVVTAGLLALSIMVSRWRRLGAGLAGTLCVLGPVVAVAGVCLAAVAPSWAPVARLWAAGSAGSAGSLVHRVDPEVVPAVAAATATGPAGTRTLLLAVTGGSAGTVRWAVERGAGARLGDASVDAGLTGTPPDSTLVLPVLSALLTDPGGPGADVRPRLADLAIGFVLLLPPIDDDAARSLDAAPGLVQVGTTGGRLLWRVDDPAGRATRARIQASGQRAVPVPSRGLGVDALIGPGTAGRLLVLAERADPGWQASLDGVALPRAVQSGWAQAFVLPADGGELRVSPPGGSSSGWRVVAVLMVAVLALPLPRVRRRVAPPTAPRRSRPVVRDPRAVRGPVRTPSPQVFDADHPADGDLGPVLSALPAKRSLVRSVVRVVLRRGR